MRNCQNAGDSPAVNLESTVNPHPYASHGLSANTPASLCEPRVIHQHTGVLTRATGYPPTHPHPYASHGLSTNTSASLREPRVIRKHTGILMRVTGYLPTHRHPYASHGLSTNTPASLCEPRGYPPTHRHPFASHGLSANTPASLCEPRVIHQHTGILLRATGFIPVASPPARQAAPRTA